MKGNPRCPKCNGRGAVMHRGRFVVCDCAYGSKEAIRAQHQRRLADPGYKSVLDRDAEQRQRG
jgi:hypothetical protein